jgi:hypothetical protein
MAAETGPSGLQGIDANYFNITDTSGMPIAGLLVMLDRLHRPVRAEVHLYDDLTEEGRDVALGRARTILQERYVSRSPVPVRIVHTYPERDAVSVTLPHEAVGAGASEDTGGLNWPFILGVVAAMAILILAGLGVARWLDNRSDSLTEQQNSAAPAADKESGEVPAAVDDGAAPQADELPLSRNARSDVGIGTRVEIVPGFQLALRSEPGADAGEEVGYMLEGQQARVIDGPVTTQGDSDTIVWWRIQMDDGHQPGNPARARRRIGGKKPHFESKTEVGLQKRGPTFFMLQQRHQRRVEGEGNETSWCKRGGIDGATPSIVQETIGGHVEAEKQCLLHGRADCNLIVAAPVRIALQDGIDGQHFPAGSVRIHKASRLGADKQGMHYIASHSVGPDLLQRHASDTHCDQSRRTWLQTCRQKILKAEKAGHKGRCRLVVYHLRRRVLLDAASVHHHNAISYRECFLLIMGDIERSDAEPLENIA